MATTTKKTPAAKKPVAALKARIDYKPGTRVKVNRPRKGDVVPGRVMSVYATPTGHFIKVNIGTSTNVIEHDARPVNVRGY